MKRAYTAAEKEFIAANFGKMLLPEIAATLGISYSRAKHIAAVLNLRKPDYTPEEGQFILNNYKALTKKDIAKALNRSYDSIRHKLTRMGLEKNGKKGKYSTNRDNWKSPTIKMAKWAIAHHSGLNVADIPDQLAEIKLLQIQIQRHGKQILP